MTDPTADDQYELELRGKPGNSFRGAFSLLFGIATGQSLDVTRHRVYVKDRRTGVDVARLDAGEDQYDSAGLLDLMRERARHCSPQEFIEEYHFELLQ